MLGYRCIHRVRHLLYVDDLKTRGRHCAPRACPASVATTLLCGWRITVKFRLGEMTAIAFAINGTYPQAAVLSQPRRVRPGLRQVLDSPSVHRIDWFRVVNERGGRCDAHRTLAPSSSTAAHPQVRSGLSEFATLDVVLSQIGRLSTTRDRWGPRKVAEGVANGAELVVASGNHGGGEQTSCGPHKWPQSE